MTPRQRLETVLSGRIPDRVPVAPDFSNMIPARRTGKPFWQLYLYNDPPIWEAYIDAAKYFGIDSLMDAYFPLAFPGDYPDADDWESFLVFRNDDKIVTRRRRKQGGSGEWAPTVDTYYRDNPPTRGLSPKRAGVDEVPGHIEPLEGVHPVDRSPEGLKRVKTLMGDQGLVGVRLASTVGLNGEEGIYEYFDHPEKHQEWADQRVVAVERRFKQIMAMDVRPDFLCVGGSGTLVTQSLEIFRQLCFPAVKRAIELATQAGFYTHVHSCGPETQLVKLMAEETTLTVIDPLEIPPMGDCNLAELKRLYGDRLVLKGNLHTTEVMLRGTPQTVQQAAIKAMRDAGQGGRFILSTGDQCGRDTPDENLFALLEVADRYGVYNPDTGTLPHLPSE